MLKIAEYNTITGEKVELKELEKYGFKLSKNLLEEEYYFKEGEYDFIEVSTENRNIFMYLGVEPEQEIVEIFYDLIKDGLVIKED